MTWVDDMEIDAVRISIDPDYRFCEGDEITLDVEFIKGYAYSSLTWDDDHFNISVTLTRKGVLIGSFEANGPEEVQEFMVQLMRQGSLHLK